MQIPSKKSGRLLIGPILFWGPGVEFYPGIDKGTGPLLGVVSDQVLANLPPPIDPYLSDPLTPPIISTPLLVDKFLSGVACGWASG